MAPVMEMVIECTGDNFSSGEPDAGNLHVRFDEGRGTLVPSYSAGSVSACGFQRG